MIKLSIKIKVLLILLVLTLIMILVMAFTMQRGFDRGFFNYRKAIDEQFYNNLLSTLHNYYDEVGAWDELYGNKRLWFDLVNRSAVEVHRELGGKPPGRKGPRPHPPKKKRRHMMKDSQNHEPLNGQRRLPREHMRRREHPHHEQLNRMRLLPPVHLLDLDKSVIVGKIHDRDKKVKYLNVKHQDQVVAYLGVFDQHNRHRQQDKRFIANIKTMLLQLAIVMAIVAIIVTFPIARYFTLLINQLKGATQRIAGGDYSARIDSQRQDELGDLARHFNLLAETLQHNAESQKTMMADIAHELRTPIAVVLAEIEAIQDGIHQADSSTLGLLHSQISSLVNLVDDLRDLSESDLGSLKYRWQHCDLRTIISDCYDNYALKFEQKNIKVAINNQHDCGITGDTQRLMQLFNNLFSNTVHYTHKNGQVHVDIECQQDWVTVLIEDSAPGLNQEQLDKIFDRWYRADPSRNRKLGGSGLGLAICHKIVQAHQGTIVAEQSSLGGIKMTLKLPREHIK